MLTDSDLQALWLTVRLAGMRGSIMLKTSLRKVGGSVMLAVPPALLEQLHLTTDNTLMIGIEGNKLVVEAAKPHYTLEDN